MQGLRERENAEFERFIMLVQEEARRRGCVFYLDYGLGATLMKNGIEYEDCMGWLIPESLAERFEPVFMDQSADADDEGTEWSRYAVFVDWHETATGVEIAIASIA